MERSDEKENAMHTAPYTMQKCKSVGVQSGATRAPSQRSVECRVQSAADRAECKVQNAGCSAECRVQSAECRVQCRSAEVQQSAECKVQSAGCSAECRVQSAECSAECGMQCKLYQCCTYLARANPATQGPSAQPFSRCGVPPVAAASPAAAALCAAHV